MNGTISSGFGKVLGGRVNSILLDSIPIVVTPLAIAARVSATNSSPVAPDG